MRTTCGWLGVRWNNVSCSYRSRSRGLTAALPSSASNKVQTMSCSNIPRDKKEQDIVGFSDPTKAFETKSNREVLRAWFVYTMLSSKILVKNSEKVRMTEL